MSDDGGANNQIIPPNGDKGVDTSSRESRGASAPAGGDTRTVLERLEDGLVELLTLKIVTLIGPISVSSDGNGSYDAAPLSAAGMEGIQTTIRLEQGDITNIMSGDAFKNEQLFSFHQQQVTMSQKIVADNVKALIDLARSLTR